MLKTKIGKIAAALVAASLAVVPASAAFADDASASNVSAGDSATSPFIEEGRLDITLDDLFGASSGSYDVKTISGGAFYKVMRTALQYHGWDYVWGGKYPEQGGFDCSGLVTQVYNEALEVGIDGWVTNASHLYTDHCTPISSSAAAPGDLVFWTGTYGDDLDYISHVGIYCGGNVVYAAGDPIGFYKIDSVRTFEHKVAPFFFGSLDAAHNEFSQSLSKGLVMNRMYNPNSGEHFYTESIGERDALIAVGWVYEGVGWLAPKTGNDVFRMYNPNTGDHHYTLNTAERDMLVSVGWIYEGVGWKSGGDTPLYRQYNPAAFAGSHNYTISKGENDVLCDNGWMEEGIGWYALD